MSEQAGEALGLADQLVFPEVDYTKVEHLHGMNITIVTNEPSVRRRRPAR